MNVISMLLRIIIFKKAPLLFTSWKIKTRDQLRCHFFNLQYDKMITRCQPKYALDGLDSEIKWEFSQTVFRN